MSVQVHWSGPATAPVQMPADPATRVRVVAAVCAELGLPDVLPASRQKLEKAQQRRNDTLQRKASATARYNRAREACRSGALPVDEYEQELLRWELWRDRPIDVANRQPNPAPMMVELMGMVRQDEAEAGGPVLALEAPETYRQLQGVAERLVAAVAELLPFEERVWTTADPAGLFVQAGRAEAWGVLLRENHRWERLHSVAAILRATGGLGAQAQLTRAPEPLGFKYRAWGKALVEEEGLAEVRPPLRLAWAVHKQWRPGLFLEGDLPADGGVEPARPGLLERARGWLIPNPTSGDTTPQPVGR